MKRSLHENKIKKRENRINMLINLKLHLEK